MNDTAASWFRGTVACFEAGGCNPLRTANISLLPRTVCTRAGSTISIGGLNGLSYDASCCCLASHKCVIGLCILLLGPATLASESLRYMPQSRGLSLREKSAKIETQAYLISSLKMFYF